MMTEEEELAALRGKCTGFLAGHGPVAVAAMLATIPADTKPDTYGEGGVVAELEAEIGNLLGKPAAVFLPTGGDGAAGRAPRPLRRTRSPDGDLPSDVPPRAARGAGLSAAPRPDRATGGAPRPTH